MRNFNSVSSAAMPGTCSGSQPAQARTKQHTLRVFSYNIRHGEGMDYRIDLQRIADVISTQNPDLVALQEVDKNCRRSGNRDIVRELGDLLGMEHRFGKSIDLQEGEYGVAILSRLPITETMHYPLPAEGAEPRSALEVQVQVEAFALPVSFISIHNEVTDENIRVKQVQALLTALKNNDNPIILAGDFNGEKTDASLRLLEHHQWRILDKQGKLTFPSDKPEVEIDFIVLRGFSQQVDIKHDVIDDKAASDHKPIYAVITMYENL